MATVQARSPGQLRPFTDAARRDAVFQAISRFPLQKDPEWKKLAKRLQPTCIDGIDAVPEGVFETDSDRFSAVATVYVRWDDRIGDRDVSSVEGLPAEVSGHFEPGEGAPVAVVDQISVDASSVLE